MARRPRRQQSARLAAQRLLIVLVAIGLSVGCVLAVPVRSASAAETARLWIDPPSVEVDGGETFTIEVLQDAPVATTGTQTTFAFNRHLARIMSVEPGPAFAGAILLSGSADDGSSGSLQATIDRANETGLLKNVASFLLITKQQ